MVGLKPLPTAMEVKRLSKAGRHSVGHGVYLQIKPSGAKTWIFRYQLAGRRREIGIGSCSQVSLADARAKGKEYRLLLSDGLDPKVQRDKVVQSNMLKQSWTFDMCAEEYIKHNSVAWKNKKHGQQWTNTLNTYASPVFGSLPVEEICNKQVLRVLEPIWYSKTETATRVRARIEKVLSWAIVQGFRDEPNPARWQGNLSEILPQARKISKQKHHAALSYKEAPIFMKELSGLETVTAQALKFTIATACRTNEVIEASWDEIDTKERVWTIPKGRMKSNRALRVPLNDLAMEVIGSLPKLDGWLFPSVQAGKHISNLAMLKLLQGGLNRPDLTVHGFRSTFRDWCAETTNHPREIAEAALAHVVKDKTEAAYQRGDLLVKRRSMMKDWSDYLSEAAENVVGFKHG